MKRGWKFLFYGITFVLFYIIFHNLSNPWFIYRFRLTVELDNNGTILSGSEVYEVAQAETPFTYFWGGSTSDVQVTGEAIDFELNGKPLFVTLTGSANRDYELNIRNIAQTLLKLSWDSPMLQQAMKDKVIVDIPLKNIPVMVTFEDIKDPQTATIVYPARLFDGLYGPNVSVKRAWLAMTTETPGEFTSDPRLPWLSGLGEREVVKMIVRQTGQGFNVPISKGAFKNGRSR